MSKSDKYIINREKILGRVSSAVVYLGIRTEDGYQCAMKCSRAGMKKEMEIMSKLDHKNIIKFLENLSNFNEFKEVIVMEYCNHGSLYEFADLHQGLCDNMFLRVLECLYKGISYLRANQLLHRDIKPGNMMVHRDNMGYFHVKLGDLGTAKRVEDDQTFKTLVGTEEYLHPDMYIQFLDKLETKFKPNVDLWSTGVTLYHSITAELPFLPYEYSRTVLRCKETLKEMYLTKKPGIISARQSAKEPYEITWSDRLPGNCRLSPMLNDLASKLIGNLMDLSEANSYERFFEDADLLLKKKRVLVFNSQNGELNILYLDTLRYHNVVDEIAKSSGFKKEELIILTRKKVLVPPADDTTECFQSLPVKGHLRYELTDDTVLVVLNKTISIRPTLVSRHLSETNCKKPSSKYKNVRESKKEAEKILRLIYQVSYSANYIDCQINCYYATMFSFNEYVMVDHVRLMNEVLQWQMTSIRDSCKMTESLISVAEEAIKNMEKYNETYQGLINCKDDINELIKKSEKGETNVVKIYSKIVHRREMFKFTEKSFSNDNDAISNDSLDFLVNLAEELVNEIKVLPEEKLHQNDNSYQMEIWQREIRLFDYYTVSKQKFEAKSKRINNIHREYYNLLKSGLGGMDTITSWKKYFLVQDEKRRTVTDRFQKIINMVKNIPLFPKLKTRGNRSQSSSNTRNAGDDAID